MNGATNMDIDDMTIGVSAAGLNQYLESIKLNVLQAVCTEIDNVEEITNAINNCWQGAARDRFIEDFATARELIKEDLKSEYINLEVKFQSLVEIMLRIDNASIYTNDF